MSWTLLAWRQPTPLSQLLQLQARDHPLRADVSLTLDPASGMLAQQTVLRHDGTGGPVDIGATTALNLRLHEPIDRILYLAGGWSEETQTRRVRPTEAGILLESRSGKTGFDFQPYLAMQAGRTTYVCEMLWSGNWRLEIRPDDAGATLIGGPVNRHFRHRLTAGTSLALPTILFGRIEGDLNRATQRLHDWRRAARPDPDRVIPIQFNSWYPFLGEPSAERLLPLVPIAKRLGCECFVIDAGWYRTDEGDGDAHWDQRTGDWRVSRERFPNGLREVRDACHAQGLGFGLWFEPEVIGSLSSIRRQHPEWLHHIDGKPPAPNQRAVLNLGVPAAWRHVFGRVTRILRSIGVNWMKWDFNADLDDGGWAPGLPSKITGQAPLIAHYQGLYRLQDAIRAAFPDLVLEMCASGGGRLDGEILAHAHVNWISDQIGAVSKLAIHFGAQLAHPAVVCNDWVIDWPSGSTSYDLDIPYHDPRGDLAFRLRVAMLGTFGISSRVDLWSAEDIALASEHIALYRDHIRPLTHHGDQYLLTRAPPLDGNGDWAALWYCAKDGASGVLFAFRLEGDAASRTFPLGGLDAERRYHVTFFSGAISTKTGRELADGIGVTLDAPYRSEICFVEAL